MIPSQWLYDFLERKEQFRPTAYKPTPKDVWTIGYGHTHGVKEGDTCTTEQALIWLKEDTAEACRMVNIHVAVPLTQEQFDSMASIMFNVGTGLPGSHDGIVYLKSGEPSTLLRKLNAGDYAGAAAEFPKWNKQAGRVLGGLVARRLEERLHFELKPAPAIA